MKRALFVLLFVQAPYLCGAQAGSVQVCIEMRERGRAAEAAKCFLSLSHASDPYLRAEGYWGMCQYRQANDEFRAAVTAHPDNPDYKTRWGRLLLERFNPADASGLFTEALESQPGHAGALLGLALIAAERFAPGAEELARKASEADPKLVEARVLLARLALEENDPERAIQEAGRALAISPEALDAMAIRAAVEWLNDKPGTEWTDRILKVNPSYGRAYAIGAHFFILKNRYEEGIELYRKAIELDPELWDARAELGLNLMRLGQDAEARRQLTLSYENGYQSNTTVNALRLLDSYKNFVFFKNEEHDSKPGMGWVLKFHRKEAEVLRPYFEAELEKALRTLESRYKYRLTRPVQVEVYPDHEDFAVRTAGMPGLAALGVSFGYVVAMDSPSGRKPGSFHWASTLWHELSHVFVLSATKHRVPRWFAEALAVYEETATSPHWGDRPTPGVIAAIREKKLLPLADLDRGFVRPSSAEQVPVSYFQAGKICEYIAREWGFDALLKMMNGFATMKSTPEVVRETLGVSTEDFDKRFAAWLESETRVTVQNFEEWRKRLSELVKLARDGNHDEVIRRGPAIRDLYPDYVEEGNPYELLAAAYLSKNDKTAAAAELRRYADRGGKKPAPIKQLAALEEESGRLKESSEMLERLIYVAPMDEELHRKLGDLWLAQGNAKKAIQQYMTVLAMEPLDQAASHFNLARAYKLANDTGQAKEHLLLALEAAPNYRPAQRLLLELSR